jgi:hypothetical protein
MYALIVVDYMKKMKAHNLLKDLFVMSVINETRKHNQNMKEFGGL